MTFAFVNLHSLFVVQSPDTFNSEFLRPGQANKSVSLDEISENICESLGRWQLITRASEIPLVPHY